MSTIAIWRFMALLAVGACGGSVAASPFGEFAAKGQVILVAEEVAKFAGRYRDARCGRAGKVSCYPDNGDLHE